MSVSGLLSDGTLVEQRTVPKSAMGPDLRHLFLGAHGQWGVITDACLRVSLLPEYHEQLVCRFRDGPSALKAFRRALQAGITPSHGTP